MSIAATKQEQTSAANAAQIKSAIDAMTEVVRDKEEVMKMLFISFLARGHVLVEDVPGVGKTTISRCLAAVLGGQFSRIQLTSDLLPVDIVGGQAIENESKTIQFKSGPIFANVVLADELNRATPRTQSGLLEAMAERSVTVDGKTHQLPNPFMVIATQNPLEHHGVYPLPESQLDRFLLRLSVGYPGPAAEVSLIVGGAAELAHDKLSSLSPIWNEEQVQQMFDHVDRTDIHQDVADYIQALVQATREHSEISTGVSTRGVLAFAAAVRARAFVEGRDYATPEDVRALFLPVCSHRITLSPAGTNARMVADAILGEILSNVSVPV